MIDHTPKQDKVIYILFYGGKKASERWITLKDQLSEEDQNDADKVFKAFANSFERPEMNTLVTSSKANNRQWLN